MQSIVNKDVIEIKSLRTDEVNNFIGATIMKKSLILVTVALMFANNSFAQENQKNVSEVKNPQIQTEEAKQSQQDKAINLKEFMDHKVYHYSDGWVEHLSPTH